MYALVIGAACGGLDLLPGFFAGYIVGYLMKYTEKYVPDGVDLYWFNRSSCTTCTFNCDGFNASSE